MRMEKDERGCGLACWIIFIIVWLNELQYLLSSLRVSVYFREDRLSKGAAKLKYIRAYTNHYTLKLDLLFNCHIIGAT